MRQRKRPTLLSKADRRILSGARRLIREITPEDYSLVAAKRDNDYRKRGKTKSYNRPSKRKGGKPPLDYSISEMLIELRKEVDRDKIHIERVQSLYLKLKGVLNW